MIEENKTVNEEMNMPEGMVCVKGGSFEMGNNDGLSHEKPVHCVYVNDFYIGKYVVTQGEWREIMGWNPSYNENYDNYPVKNVSWNDVQEYLLKLNVKKGQHYRLPTEAEWEYTARGGNKSCGYNYSGSNVLDDVAWYSGNAGGETHPVGTKQSNELGIYDMTGNVLEWCNDWFDENYYNNSPTQNPQGPSSGIFRVLRGGTFGSSSDLCSITIRSGNGPYQRISLVGFRLALDK